MYAPLTLLFGALLFFAVRAWHGLRFIGFVDESEHLLGSRMLNHGAILYRNFISQHGPFTFMLTQAYGALFGWRHPSKARLISVGLALLAAGCIGASTALPQRAARLWGAALFLGLTASVWLLQVLYLVNYHAIAGFFLVVALALCAVPVWCGAAVSRPRAAAAGAACVLVAATAYSFAPAMVLLAASMLWGLPARRAFGIGMAAAAGAVLVWLLCYGDILGYIAFHFVLNQFFFVKFMPFGIMPAVRGIVPGLEHWPWVHSLAVLCCVLSFALLLGMNRARRGPIALGCAAILALNARGTIYFQDGSLLLAGIGLFALIVPQAVLRAMPEHTPASYLAASVLMGLCIIGAEYAGRQALSSPFGMTRAQMGSVRPVNLGTSWDPQSTRMRALVPPDEPILAIPNQPDIYFSANRWPMDRYSYYLPWDAAYAAAPWHGQTHDLCKDLPNAPPRLIYFNHWRVGNRYDLEQYAPCVVAYLNSHYQRQSDFPNLYLRIDAPGPSPSPMPHPP